MLLAPQGLLLYCRHLGVTARLKPLLWTVAVLYTFGFYSEVCVRPMSDSLLCRPRCAAALSSAPALLTLTCALLARLASARTPACRAYLPTATH
jgi:hypothetical protein